MSKTRTLNITPNDSFTQWSLETCTVHTEAEIPDRPQLVVSRCHTESQDQTNRCALYKYSPTKRVHDYRTRKRHAINYFTVDSAPTGTLWLKSTTSSQNFSHLKTLKSLSTNKDKFNRKSGKTRCHTECTNAVTNQCLQRLLPRQNCTTYKRTTTKHFTEQPK